MTIEDAPKGATPIPSSKEVCPETAAEVQAGQMSAKPKPLPKDWPNPG
jgi:hypothetical protein